MHHLDEYEDLDGNRLPLAGLDAEERQLVARLRRRARTHPDWTDFDNYWTRAVTAFYDARGMSRRRSRQTVPYRIGQDLSGRLGIAAGLMRPDDFVGDVEMLIREEFPSPKAFCRAMGLAEKTLREFLAERQDLSLAELDRALAKIGYAVRVRPSPARRLAAQQRKRTG